MSRLMRFFAVTVGLVAGLALFLAVDTIVGARLLRAPGEVAPIPAESQPYLQLDRGWYQLKRNFRGRDYWGSRIYDVVTDEHGFRVDDRRPPKPGAGQVIFLGDSFTYGVTGPSAETFVGMYEDASSVKVLNAAVPSYSPTPYLHAYRSALQERALADNHDVILMLDVSDVEDEAAVWEDGPDHPVQRDLPDTTPAAGALRVFARTWRDRLRLTAAVYSTVRYSILRIPDAAEFDQYRSAFTWDDWAKLDRVPAARSGYAPDGVARALDRVRAKIAAIGELASRSGGRVFVGVYPWPGQLVHAPHFDWPGFVRDACRGVCAGVIDTFPVFTARAAADRHWYRELYVFNDVHFTIAGNRLVYEQIAAVVPPH